jgi:hypothetical protein
VAGWPGGLGWLKTPLTKEKAVTTDGILASGRLQRMLKAALILDSFPGKDPLRRAAR